MKQAISLVLGAVLASLVPQPPQISGDVREFLAGWEMIDYPLDYQGNTVRVARYTGSIQIVNGAGATDVANGTGNLIIGYAEPTGALIRHGSHNLVGGRGQNYNSEACGGIAFGSNAGIFGPFCVALGGEHVTAAGNRSVVTGGQHSTAQGAYSVVSGGYARTAPGDNDWVAGSLFEDN